MATRNGTNGNDALYGTADYDTINGGGGNDTLVGFGGADRLDGGAGIDTAFYFDSTVGVTVNLETGRGFDGSAEGDTLFSVEYLWGSNYGDWLMGDGGTNDLYGLDGDDILIGGVGNVVDGLDGGAGDDILTGGGGADYLDGGAGIDTADYSQAPSASTTGVQVSIAIQGRPLERYEPGDEKGDTLFNIENINGSNFQDVLYGSDGNNVLRGLGGDDDLRGNRGDDTLEGGFGDDVLRGYEDDDTLDGGYGNDNLYGGTGADTMIGGEGWDTFYVDDAGDVVIGDWTDKVITTVSYTIPTGSKVGYLQTESEDSTVAMNLTGSEVSNVITGNNGANVIDGGAGTDLMIGRGGADIYYVDDARDRVEEDPIFVGSDRVSASMSFTLGMGQSVETLTTNNAAGTAAIDLTGNEFDNVIEGNAGNNVLDGKGGADTLSGFAGDDTYSVDNALDRVLAEGVGQGTDILTTTVSYSLNAGLSIESIKVGDAATTGDFNLTGNETANIITGNAGNNLLNGGGGIDKLQGLAGNDTYFVETAADAIVEAAGQGTDNVNASVSYTLSAGVSVETLQSTNTAGTAALTLIGNEFADTIIGNSGNNILSGAGGTDTLRGLGGNNSYLVDSTADTIVEAAGQGTDNVNASVSYVLKAGVSAETLRTTNAAGTAAINLTGNEFANFVTGNGGSNILNGGVGADTLQGLAGNDSYFVDNAGDKIIEAAGFGTDNVNASVSYKLAVGVTAETLRTTNAASTAAINLTGNELNNLMIGNAGANVLNGGGSMDVLTGNAGNDMFEFNTALAPINIDIITDFTVVNDTVRLENAVFTGLAAGTLNADAFHIGTAAADAEDRIVYNSTTGALIFDSNGSAAGGATQFAKLATGLALTNADFVVV